jgi:2-succinyl-5-enolpyruvyl-6-hydroxy-3-cyclohexene-1-carboxylate synthase
VSTVDLNLQRGHAILQACAEAGVCDLVLSPGSRSTPLVLAAEAVAPRLRIHIATDERAAGFFALGLAHATGAPVALLCTSGSAGAHYLPALVEARATHLPLVVLTADRPAELHGCGAPQTIPQRDLFGAHVVASEHLEAAEPGEQPRLVVTASRLVQAALAPGGGPVHLNVAFREPLWQPEACTPLPAPRSPRIVQGPRRLERREVRRLARRLAAVKRGAIVAGPRAPRASDPRWRAVVSELGQRLGWPVLADPTSQLRFGRPASAPIIVGYDGLLRDAAWASDHRAEQVLRLGRLPTSGAAQAWLGRASAQILVDADGDWHDPWWAAEALYACDPLVLCADLLAELPACPHRDWSDAWQAADRQAAEATAALLEHDLWGGAIASAVASALPAGAALHVASSLAIRDLEGFADRAASVAVFANRGAHGIDGTLATALGESASGRFDPVVVLAGDLAFLHGLSDLAHLPPAHPLVVVCVDNDGGGIFDHLAVARHPSAFERAFVTPHGQDLGRLGAAFGLETRSLASLPELRQALAVALGGSAGSHRWLLHVPIDRTRDLELHQAAWAATARALTFQGPTTKEAA